MSCSRFPIRRRRCSRARTCSRSAAPTRFAAPASTDAIALIGFDDIPLADLVDPAISVVAQDPQGIGQVAAELLFRRLDGDTSPTVHHVMPVELIARGSGEFPP